ncbi:LytR/AlgR family response regulator transcription factor [Cognataquiflexum aquatile]|uniref:LytR/AlgR family response regulator transcription factor n=1 Tax=Cognataquiflexum aquatile TaxID=2249427 RepID=UPI000DE8F1B5|nr:LytTR family DNA-binding domain-containing protein [Cognataquiflexum aquatile]
MFKVIIIDDEFHAQEVVELLLKKYFPNKFSIEAKCCSVEEGIKQINSIKPELVFLDVQMPEKNGFSLLDHFGKKTDFEVIFSTAHREYAFEAIKHQALDYLLKPIDPVEFVETIAKFEEKWEGKKVKNVKEKMESVNILSFTTQDGIYFMDYDDILYCKSEQSYTKIFKADGTDLLVSKKLAWIENKLPKNQFFRIHHSFLVNVKKIDRYDKKNNFLFLKNGHHLSVSFRRSSDLIRHFA